MRYVLIALVIAALPIVGVATQTEDKSIWQQEVRFLGVQADQAALVGLGILGGALGLHVLVGSGSAMLGGAMAGALISNWWYEQRSVGSGRTMAVTYTAR